VDSLRLVICVRGECHELFLLCGRCDRGQPGTAATFAALVKVSVDKSASYHFSGRMNAMRTVIDRAGRIVVPKVLRQALGLKPGQPLDIRAGDGRLEIDVAVTPMRLKKRGKGLVAVPDAPLPALTAEQVRDTLERVRR
jgi:AbrB family looped-hinge helix DNA binding protein